jgi:hypothetical protein
LLLAPEFGSAAKQAFRQLIVAPVFVVVAHGANHMPYAGFAVLNVHEAPTSIGERRKR